MIVRPDRITAAVIGLGTMGSGIARLLLAHGATVRGFDAHANAGALGADDRLAGLELAESLSDAVRGADVVFEAVFEDIDVKEAVLGEIGRSTDSVIASNTSTFVPTRLARFVREPGRLLVAHFFNPSDVIPLVEVVPHAGTSRDLPDQMAELLRAVGKRPVVLRRERPGFVANRLQAAILRESLALVEEGVVTPDGIDEVVRSALAPRWSVAGPIGVADLGGLDVFLAVCSEIFPTLADASAPSSLLVDAVEAGRLGAKTGRGFYPHTPESVQRAADAMAHLFASAGGGDLRRSDESP